MGVVAAIIATWPLKIVGHNLFTTCQLKGVDYTADKMMRSFPFDVYRCPKKPVLLSYLYVLVQISLTPLLSLLLEIK